VTKEGNLMTRKARNPLNRVSVGDRFPDLTLTAITGETVTVPDTAGALTHLQFRRFAGCPICNLHLRSITARIDEINAAGIREVVVFHSTASELRKYQDDMPFPVIGDPDKTLYHRFGVEASAKAVLNPRAWRALPVGWRHAIGNAVAHRRAPLPLAPTNGNLGLPADLLITADGSVAAVKYGVHAYDQWSVDEVLDLAIGFGRDAET
jgi:peroxiredoxin